MNAPPPSPCGPTRAQEAELGRAWARAWRERMRPIFDQMDAAGAFWDSPLRHRELLK